MAGRKERGGEGTKKRPKEGEGGGKKGRRRKEEMCVRIDKFGSNNYIFFPFWGVFKHGQSIINSFFARE